LAAVLGLSPIAAQAQVELAPPVGDGPGVYVSVAFCIVVGQVDLSDGGTIPEGAPWTDNEDEGPGTYVFKGTVVCAGVVSGVCPTASAGTTDNTDGTSGFDGTFIAGPCVPPGQICNGRVGGPAINQNNFTGPPFIGPSGLLDAPWSFTAGQVILGGLDQVNCTAGPLGVPPGISDGDGIVSLEGSPLLFQPTAPCEDAGGEGLLAASWYCSIEVSGVAVITQEVPGDNP
jgi:hypothetical protein